MLFFSRHPHHQKVGWESGCLDRGEQWDRRWDGTRSSSPRGAGFHPLPGPDEGKTVKYYQTIITYSIVPSRWQGSCSGSLQSCYKWKHSSEVTLLPFFTQAERTIKWIKGECGLNAQIEFEICNLASFKSIRACVKSLETKISKVDYLINNAGELYAYLFFEHFRKNSSPNKLKVPRRSFDFQYYTVHSQCCLRIRLYQSGVM